MKREGKINDRTLLNIFMVLFFISFISLYLMLDKYIVNPADEIVNVTHVIDGDTIKIIGENEEERTIRFLGINCAEKGMDYYDNAKLFLEGLIGGKEISLVKDKNSPDEDKYHRELRYVYFEGKFVNKLLIENGLANVYILEPIEKEKELREAWSECLKNERNLCKYSEEKCVDCIVVDKIEKFEEYLVLRNRCEFECNLTGWSIKDEGRNMYFFPEFTLPSKGEITLSSESGEDNLNELFMGLGEVWTESGDSLFLRDNEGKLVLYYNY